MDVKAILFVLACIHLLRDDAYLHASYSSCAALSNEKVARALLQLFRNLVFNGLRPKQDFIGQELSLLLESTRRIGFGTDIESLWRAHPSFDVEHKRERLPQVDRGQEMRLVVVWVHWRPYLHSVLPFREYGIERSLELGLLDVRDANLVPLCSRMIEDDLLSPRWPYLLVRLLSCC